MGRGPLAVVGDGSRVSRNGPVLGRRTVGRPRFEISGAPLPGSRGCVRTTRVWSAGTRGHGDCRRSHRPVGRASPPPPPIVCRERCWGSTPLTCGWCQSVHRKENVASSSGLVRLGGGDQRVLLDVDRARNPPRLMLVVHQRVDPLPNQHRDRGRPRWHVPTSPCLSRYPRRVD